MTLTLTRQECIVLERVLKECQPKGNDKTILSIYRKLTEK